MFRCVYIQISNSYKLIYDNGNFLFSFRFLIKFIITLEILLLILQSSGICPSQTKHFDLVNGDIYFNLRWLIMITIICQYPNIFKIVSNKSLQHFGKNTIFLCVWIMCIMIIYIKSFESECTSDANGRFSFQ